jgi:hypothetical protein
MKFLKCTIILFFLGSLFPGISFANPNNYLVTPPLIDETVEPRDIWEREITVTNNSPQRIRLFPTVSQISSVEGLEIVPTETITLNGRATDVTTWIAIHRGRFEIDPFSTATITVGFQISPTAEPGTYHALISFPNGKNRPEAEATIVTRQVPSTIVTLRIPETTTELLQLKQFFAERFITDISKRAITVSLENTGDTSVKPVGSVIFYNTRGVEIGSVPIPDLPELQPGENRTISFEPPEAVSFGKYKAFLKVDYGRSQNASLYDTAFFTVVPVFWLVGILGLLLFVTGLLTWFYHRSTQNQVYNEDADDIPFVVRTDVKTEPKDHDINLK